MTLPKREANSWAYHHEREHGLYGKHNMEKRTKRIQGTIGKLDYSLSRIVAFQSLDPLV